MINYKLYIDGKWVNSQNQKTFDVFNPATGDLIAQVGDASDEDVDAAITAADNAFKSWSSLPAPKRSEILRNAYDIMMDQKEDLAKIMTLEQGKPLHEARNEIQYAADFVSWYSEEAKRIYGDTIPSSHPSKRIMVIKEAVGVVAAITPWNFPASMITRKVAPALAAGCTVVVKPGKQTPLSACRLVEVFEQAGVPAGVINLVTGSSASAIGDVLLKDDRVKKVTFTGSTPVGKIIMKKAADTMKKVSLELGGHAPSIIFEDADIDQAVKEVVESKFRNAGQTCLCTNRIYVHERIIDTFTDKFVEVVKNLRVGNGMEPNVDIGPLIDQAAAEKVDQQVQDAVNKGAVVAVGGKFHEPEKADQHVFFYEPTVLTNVTNDMVITHEETFGPVVPIQSFQTEEEVIQSANDSPYGLGAYFYTRDISRAIRVAESLQYGIIGVNDGQPSAAQAPFGGLKESGLGREGGKYGLEEYLEIKYLSLKVKETPD
ncbi:NAD-dependent succinate-semialdehyde dehydrogenase [Marininema halotolerans]|uniref:Succinate-semialdehyde dehydrogenase / glutarate-semialdehyde dehydrogenase n=1 Tax=Marininema halotolerans TaxID=1155944 RepID=A0A1I6TNN1_9BACL|nr:NAD-dependent succinate-semialdehyde dehydrogenase [Marininema halotolerans]SFS90816.1 succinate-semialdehyde dehydrogenase / glutarate-semialdehyde dehydrogenase [Marininema halotolerans]